MPSRSSNTLGRFLAATACLTHEEIMASPLPFLAEDASDEDDYNDDEDDEEPHLANITLESDMSEPESPSEKNLSMEVQLGDSFVLDNNKEEDNQGRVEESHVTLPPLDLNEATQVCIPLEEGLLQMDLLECRTVENRRIGSIYCHSTVNHGSLGLLRYLSQVYGANNDWRHVTILNVGAGPGVVGLGVAALSHGKAAVAMMESPRLLPLLEMNLERNKALWEPLSMSECDESDTSFVPLAHVCEWGKPTCKEWLRNFFDGVSQATVRREKRTVIITVTDFVCRRSLWEPLLLTLSEFLVRVREFTHRKRTKVECVLACPSAAAHVSLAWYWRHSCRY